MFLRLVTLFAVLAAGVVVPLGAAQDLHKLKFDIGGGITTPLNPTARYAGLSGSIRLPLPLEEGAAEVSMEV